MTNLEDFPDLGVNLFTYRWTWIWQTQWDQENWSVICKIRCIHMTNTWYASDWDQAYRPSNPSYSGPSYPSSPVHSGPWGTSFICFICTSSMYLLKIFQLVFEGEVLIRSQNTAIQIFLDFMIISVSRPIFQIITADGKLLFNKGWMCFNTV